MTREIKLTQGYVALVSDMDYEALSNYRWYVWKRKDLVYAIRSNYIRGVGPQKIIYMHNAVLGPSNINMVIDHIDGNTLNNQRENLRYANRVQNAQNRRTQDNNTSGYKGVHYSKLHNMWRARITVNGKRLHLGLFDTPEEAHEVYKVAANQYFGEFVRLETKRK